MDVEAHTALLNFWSSAGERLRPSGSETGVRDIEARYDVKLPEDFRRYLLNAVPAEDLWDDEHTTWWPLSRIRNIPEEYEYPIGDPEIAAEAAQFLFFADFLIWSWAWAICCSAGPNRGKVALIGGLPDRFVASSFTEFVELYLRDSASVC